MKVNLLTIHYSLSYGAVMQTYATCKVLEKLGCKVTIINFKNDIEKIKNKSFKYWIINGIRKFKFEIFRKKYLPPLTKEMYTPDLSLMPKADLFLSGSDQIWNPKITKGNLLTYMFAFLPDNIRRISYASSFGLNEWDPNYKENKKIHEALRKFNKISVREDKGVEICNKIFGLDATHVLDPTLLLEKEEYFEITGEVKEKDEIICFKFSQNEEFIKCAHFIKNELHLKLSLLNTCRPKPGFNKYIFTPFLGPVKWLKKIASAKFIITDSFHGLTFAIIFNKDFVVIPGATDRTIRLTSLLNKLSLSDRYVNNYQDLLNRRQIIHSKINYDQVNQILQHEREKSISFLKNGIFNLK